MSALLLALGSITQLHKSGGRGEWGYMYDVVCEHPEKFLTIPLLAKPTIISSLGSSCLGAIQAAGRCLAPCVPGSGTQPPWHAIPIELYAITLALHVALQTSRQLRVVGPNTLMPHRATNIHNGRTQPPYIGRFSQQVTHHTLLHYTVMKSHHNVPTSSHSAHTHTHINRDPLPRFLSV
jgi:hypothetical protein